MEQYNIFVGGVSGVFKGLKASHNKGIHNIKNLQILKEIRQRNEVTALNWADKLESEILVGYGSQLIKIYDLNANKFTCVEEKKVGDGPIRGIFQLNGSLVTAVESGIVKIWGGKETVLETGGHLSRMRQSPNEANMIGTGGKENDLKLWDLETGKITFQAKNVRHDELELRVPVWVMDLAFKPDSRQVAVATRYGHVRLYDPATPTRRPVCQVTVKDHSFTCIAVAPREHHVVVGCTTGNMYLVDLRGKGLLLNKYRGFMGSVRQVACPSSEPFVLSVSLDRHLRIHHLHSKQLLFKEYMQSRLSTLLLRSNFTMEDIKEETQEIKEEVDEFNNDAVYDEEYEQLFDQMEVVGEQKPISRKKKKIKSRNKDITIDDESEEEYKQLFDQMEVVSEKNTKSKVNTKSKTRSRKYNEEDQSEEENRELLDYSEVVDVKQNTEKRQKPKVKSKSKRLKKQESEMIVVN